MGQRLLLVDSDRRFIKDHQVALESAFDVEYLNATEGVIPRLENGDFAAVLICVEVSENKGYALCSAIRKNPKLADLKVILISAKATEEEYTRHRSLKGRADLYLHKPIISGSLVAALTPLVPSRAMDPDNPLGDLSGADLGDEWLESLKTELDTEEKPKAPPAPVAPVPVVVRTPLSVKTGPAAPSMATVAIQVPPKLQSTPAVSPEAGKVALLEARVKDLEYKLQASADALAQKDKELEETKLLHAAVAQNLEVYSGQSQGELNGLRAQLEEVEGDHQRLRVTVEDLGRQLTEKEQEVADLQQGKRDQEWKIGELQGEIDRANQQLELASALEKRVEELSQELERQEAEKQELVAKLEARDAEIATKNSEAEAARVDLTGLEATLRAQRRELAEQEGRLNAVTKEQESRLNAVTKELESLKEKTKGSVAQTEELQALILERDKALSEKGKEITQLIGEHEKQQLELLHALDEKESTLGRMNATLESQRDRIANLERERQEMEGNLNERTARLEALTGAITDLENNIRRASDLTRPV